jgi:hypothetical protein
MGVNDMTRAEAYWILHEMMVETFSADQSKALSIALHDIQFVDLMPSDTIPVVRCKDCIHWNKDALACDTLPWVDSSEHENWYADDFCSYGERKDGDG